jgi:SAM-dependent methyltransferase
MSANPGESAHLSTTLQAAGTAPGGGSAAFSAGAEHQPCNPLGDRADLAYQWLPQVASVLDLGCADGYVTAHLRSKASRIVGFDIDLKDVHAAKTKVRGAHFLVGSVEALPFAAASFDAVLFLDVLEHVGNDRRSIDEVERVLRPGGYLILSTPHKGLFSFLDPENFFLRGKNGEQRHRHRHYSIAEYQDLFDGRFRVLRAHRGGLVLFPLCVIARKIACRLAGDGWAVPTFLGRLIDRGLDRSYKMNFGKLGFNLMVLAQKRRRSELT